MVDCFRIVAGGVEFICGRDNQRHANGVVVRDIHGPGKRQLEDDRYAVADARDHGGIDDFDHFVAEWGRRGGIQSDTRG